MTVAIKFVHAKNLIRHTPMDGDDDAQSSYILNVRILGRKFFPGIKIITYHEIKCYSIHCKPL